MSDILANRRAQVLTALGNRADLSVIQAGPIPSRIDNWLRNSYLEIGACFDFAEAEISATGQIIQGTDDPQVAFPNDARAIKSLVFYRLDGTVCAPEWKDITTIRMYNNQAQGPPSIMCVFGQGVIVRPKPDNTYNWVMDYWQAPQIIDSGIVLDGTQAGPSGDIGQTVLKVPDDWLEVIDYGAMMRGYAELPGMQERAAQIQSLLYGVTLPQGKTSPGLIAAKMTRRQAMAPTMDYGMVPKQARRSYGSSVG